MLCTCYLKKNMVYVPSIGKRGGAYVVMEPIAAVPVANTNDLHHAFAQAIAREPVILPLLKRQHPPFVMLKYTGDKSWAAFARSTQTWDIRETETGYKIVGWRLHPGGHLVEDKLQTIEFHLHPPLDTVIDRMIALLQEAARGQNG